MVWPNRPITTLGLGNRHRSSIYRTWFAGFPGNRSTAGQIDQLEYRNLRNRFPVTWQSRVSEFSENKVKMSVNQSREWVCCGSWRRWWCKVNKIITLQRFGAPRCGTTRSVALLTHYNPSVFPEHSQARGRRAAPVLSVLFLFCLVFSKSKLALIFGKVLGSLSTFW